MIDTENFSYDEAYFAAANGYSGFRSQFDEIFHSESYERIYVLKGGPGTGKSTIMKGLLKHAGADCHKTAIFCSSDPDSLDGVILERGGRRIAVLDGTAPHERDAVIPGAIDQIINLGEGFITEKLREHREEILRLNSLKKTAYKNAYSYLGTAGAVWNNINSVFSVIQDYSEAELSAKRMLAGVSESKSGGIKYRYISSFGRRGYCPLPDFSTVKKRTFSLVGGYKSEQEILCVIIAEIKKSATSATVHLCPLDDRIIESVMVGDCIFIASELPSSKPLSDAPGDKARLVDIHRDLLSLAEQQFMEASVHHFALEDIYKSAVDFDRNDATFSRITEDIDILLGG